MIVLVHGLGVSHRYFAPLRRLLPGAAAPDLAGATVDALTRSLEASVASPSLLVANSLGCQVSAELAVRRPALVRGLVLIGPTWDPGAPTVPRQLGRLLRGSYREPPPLVSLLVADYARWGPARLLSAARSMLAHPMADRLAALEAPVVCLRGEHDTICSRPWARLVAGVARAPLVEVAGAAHAAHWSHPRAVVEVVEELLQHLGES